MCFEDVKIGLRRYEKSTFVTGGAGLQLAPNAQRVGIRLIIQIDTSGAGNNVKGLTFGEVAASSNVRMFVNGSEPIDEITLEQHGKMVQSGFAFIPGNVLSFSVIEIIDNELDKAPKAGSPYDK